MIKVSICIAVYSRPERLPAIKEQLKVQTFQDFEFLIWDNTEDNKGSQARFWLVKEAKGEAIIFIDDDETLQPDFVEYMYAQYLKYPKHILGWFTRIFHQESYWDSILFSPYGTEVDYVGTGGMIVDREIFDRNPVLYNIPLEFCRAEDLYLSYIARECGYKLMSIDKHISIEVDGKDQYNTLRVYKDNSFGLLRMEGWKLVRERDLTTIYTNYTKG